MDSHNRDKGVSLVMGLAFVVLGGLSIVSNYLEGEWVGYISSNGNLMLGLSLMVAGAIFLTGAARYSKGMDGEAYIIVGCMMGMFIGLVSLLTLLADASEAYLLLSEDFVEWTPMDDFTPAIPMMVPCLVILWYKLKAFKAVKPNVI